MTLFFGDFGTLKFLRNIGGSWFHPKSISNIFWLVSVVFWEANLPKGDGHYIFQVAPKTRWESLLQPNLIYAKRGLNKLYVLSHIFRLCWLKAAAIFSEANWDVPRVKFCGHRRAEHKIFGTETSFGWGKKKELFSILKIFCLFMFEVKGKKKGNSAIFGRTCMGNLLFFFFFN